MGFGGAFAPNRFERVSTLVAAWIQRKHRDFYARQPYPPAAQRWAERRAERQRRGGIPGGAAQRAPRCLQVYIDDFTGVALTDEVTPPQEVAHITTDPMHTRVGGGRAGWPDVARLRARAASGEGAGRTGPARSAGEGGRGRPRGGPRLQR
eukprot:2971963-Pleurochrysis_carterae.AAC.1